MRSDLILLALVEAVLSWQAWVATKKLLGGEPEFDKNVWGVASWKNADNAIRWVRIGYRSAPVLLWFWLQLLLIYSVLS